ncbi:MAG: HupE/UreJ family protein [Pseudomonadota bacterium]
MRRTGTIAFIFSCLVLIAGFIAFVPPPVAHAHEVRPSIADVTVKSGTVDLSIALNVEAFIAGIQLDGLDNTDNASNAPDYNRLRALEPAALQEAFRKAWPTIAKNFTLRDKTGPVTPQLVGLTVPPVGNLSQLRTSVLKLKADATAPVQVGWTRSYGRLIVRQQGLAKEAAYTGLLSGGEMSPPISVKGVSSEGGWATFVRYIGVGFDHIIPKGLDHILFVLGLFFLSPRIGPLLWQVSAFTLAHTVTLALGALGVVNVPASIVEPLIAASIVYVAVENIIASDLKRWRPALVFAFGLLHGLGFASVLGEFGLPQAQFVPALIGFNIGVELGQLAVIALAFLAVGLWFRARPWYRGWIAVPASLVIAAIGAYWAIERTVAVV